MKRLLKHKDAKTLDGVIGQLMRLGLFSGVTIPSEHPLNQRFSQYLKIHRMALTPSLQPIFFPSA
jgi:hypothetical protein